LRNCARAWVQAESLLRGRPVLAKLYASLEAAERLLWERLAASGVCADRHGDRGEECGAAP